MNMEGNGHSLF